MDIIDFINAFTPPLPRELEEIYVNKGGPPAIPLETAQLLIVLLTMKKPKSALEIGTSFGFSACLTAFHIEKDGQVYTIERNAPFNAFNINVFVFGNVFGAVKDFKNSARFGINTLYKVCCRCDMNRLVKKAFAIH